MNALHTLTSQVPSTRRPLLRGAIASAVLALAGTATTGALAQVPQHTPALGGTDAGGRHAPFHPRPHQRCRPHTR